MTHALALARHELAFLCVVAVVCAGMFLGGQPRLRLDRSDVALLSTLAGNLLQASRWTGNATCAPAFR